MIEKAIAALKRGEFVIVTDDKRRENEGDLIFAAEFATEEKLAFMIRNTCGIICVALPDERLQQLELPQMVEKNTDPKRTAFSISVDVKHGTTTGISASDRTKTILALANPEIKPEDFSRPGHIFPLRAKEGGVLKRAGHTESAVDLMNLAGVTPAGVICELVNDDGTVAKDKQIEVFAEKHNIPLIAIADLIRYRRKHEQLVEKVSSATLPTPFGEFNAHVYRSRLDGIEHMALVKGEVNGKEDILVRVHSECLTGDIFGSERCDCGTQLQRAMAEIEKNGSGVIVYLRGHEGRGIGLGHKLKAYQLQDNGRDTVEANIELGLPVDSREYGIGAQILVDLGITTIHLMTNNPAKYSGIEGYDLKITKRIPLICPSTPSNSNYLATKKRKLGHLL